MAAKGRRRGRSMTKEDGELVTTPRARAHGRRRSARERRSRPESGEEPMPRSRVGQTESQTAGERQKDEREPPRKSSAARRVVLDATSARCQVSGDVCGEGPTNGRRSETQWSVARCARGRAERHGCRHGRFSSSLCDRRQRRRRNARRRNERQGKATARVSANQWQVLLDAGGVAPVRSRALRGPISRQPMQDAAPRRPPTLNAHPPTPPASCRSLIIPARATAGCP